MEPHRITTNSTELFTRLSAHSLAFMLYLIGRQLFSAKKKKKAKKERHCKPHSNKYQKDTEILTNVGGNECNVEAKCNWVYKYCEVRGKFVPCLIEQDWVK